MSQNPKFDAGTIIILAEGEYSDYRTGPLFRCLKDVNLEDLAREFYPNAPKSEWSGRRNADASTFTLWLIQNGWVEELEYSEVHVGSYGEFECFGFTGHD